ncbi:HIT domain-containing protein [Candidatus Wolfebacteria bacterium]|nr:HIT domain-containing protein [Candidatus Wolfebacteria bacterium]
MNCVFCKIVKKEIPAEFVYEKNNILVFADIRPKAPVHYLVIPEAHIESILYLEEVHKKVISEMVFAAKEVAQKLELKGYKLVFNVGKEGGQVVDHLHLHLLGGWSAKADIDRLPHPGLKYEA